MEKSFKINKILWHIPFALLFVMAVFLFRERLYADSGYYLINAINKEFFYFEHNRFVLILSQVLPVAGIWLKANLNTILLLYSINHVLFFYIIFIIVFHLYKERYAGLLIILLQLVGIHHSFFTPQFEMYYGIGLLVLFYVLLKHYKKSLLPALLILQILILTSHPISIALFIFVVLFNIFFEKYTYSPKVLIGFLIVLIAVIVFKIFTISEYEANKVIFHFDFERNKHYLDFLQLAYIPKFFSFFVRSYIDLCMIIILMVYEYIRKRSYKKLIFSFLFIFGYLLVVNISYASNYAGRYTEQVYFPVVFLVLFPYIIDQFSSLRMPKFQWIILAVIIVFRFTIVTGAGKEFKQRSNQLSRITAYAAENEICKVLLKEKNINRPYSHITWSLPIESLLISSATSPGSSVTLSLKKEYDLISQSREVTDNEYIFRLDEIYNLDQINNNYFNLINQPYYYLCNKNDTIGIEDYDFTRISLNLNPNASYKRNELEYIPISIKNINALPLYASRKNKISISYHWYKDGEYYLWDGLRTDMEVDIQGVYSQDFLVHMPDQKGDFILIADLVWEDEKWFDCRQAVEVKIR